MSVTITAQIVDVASLIPSTIPPAEEEKLFLPRVFEQRDVAGFDRDHDHDWPLPLESDVFRSMLYQFNDLYVARYVWPEGIDGDTTGRHSGIIPTDKVPDTIKWENALRHTETVTLGRKSWKYANREEFESCMTKQDHILRTLTMHLYFRTHATDSLWISCTTQAKQYYFIGGKQYASRPESAVTARLQSQRIPILSFTGWFPGQTWSEFVGEILAIMLGQLACNFRHEVQDQEVFLVGFFGCQIFIARGFFPLSQIQRVHAKGCSAAETFPLEFSRGYDISRKQDWIEFTQNLQRLLRYLVNGKAKVGGVRACLQANSAST